MIREALTPAYKGIADFDADTLEILRDAQAISSDNVSGSEIQYFPRSTAGQSEADANYTKNPLPGDRPYDILGIGFEFSHQYVEEPVGSSDIDLEAFTNHLFDASVLLRTDQRREQLINKHLQLCVQIQTMDFTLTPDAANQGFEKTLKLPAKGLLRIDDPIHISTQEVFDLTVRWASVSSFPSDTNWANLAQGGPLKMMAKLFVAYNE